MNNLIVIKENGLNQFETIMSALKACDYNLNTASRALFLHKNTLVYQFNKIRQALNIDPIHSQADRILVENLLSYMKNSSIK